MYEWEEWTLDKVRFLQKKAIGIREDIIRMIYKSQMGHIGGSLSSVDILVTLYYEIMNIDPKNPKAKDRDRFILSKGHSVEAYYAILGDMGFFPKEELGTFGKYKSRLIGHPSVKIPGVEINTGSLGHGLSNGVGMALAAKMDKKSYKVYVLMGDGELAEGSIWEGAMAASHFGLDNLVGIVDRNHLQISGETEDIMKLENLIDKWRAFGWDVTSVDGHDIGDMIHVFNSLSKEKGKPHVMIANTVKGKGISFMQNSAVWHHKVPDEVEFNTALGELDTQLKELICCDCTCSL